MTSLTTGGTNGCKSCQVADKNRTHGMTGHPLYTTWLHMIERCTDRSAKSYKDYGGRGISVCDEWAQDNGVFFDWAKSHGWKAGLQIDRIDNAGDYCPENCRFVTPQQNSRNRRSNILVSIFGKTQTVVEWCEELGIKNAGMVRLRLRAGACVTKALLVASGKTR